MHSFPLSSLIIWVFLTQEFKRGQLNKIILYFIMADLKTYSGSLSDHIMWINVQTGLKLYAGWQDKFIKHMRYLTFLNCWHHLIYVWTGWSLFASLVPLQLLEVSFFLSENCELMYWFFVLNPVFLLHRFQRHVRVSNIALGWKQNALSALFVNWIVTTTKKIHPFFMIQIFFPTYLIFFFFFR